ncbi:MAG: SDR family oxidoreductase [Vallitaleaceae bacterium]|jgi:NAD(P)-dependent dehydrogenase (short-subunit alcohol dehydrogenase family)|nr:SDR family oxidoreductase [Vallitaleaceae bacterium]
MSRAIDIKGKVAVVTGGGGVLCGEMARELGRNGCKVAVLDLKLDKAKSVAEEIISAGGIAIGVEANVLEKDSIEQAKSLINDAFGQVDILINGAGGNHSKGTTSSETFQPEDLEDDMQSSFFDMQLEGFGFVFNLNFMGTLLTTQVFAKDMLGEKESTIINISSMSAYAPMTKVPAYSAAKAAINNFTMWMAVHFAGRNIRVNAIAPGFFLTEQNRTLLTHSDGSLTPRSTKILSQTPMNRFGTPEDLLGTLVWLLDTQLSGFITGVVIPVDGGFMAYSGV